MATKKPTDRARRKSGASLPSEGCQQPDKDLKDTMHDHASEVFAIGTHRAFY